MKMKSNKVTGRSLFNKLVPTVEAETKQKKTSKKAETEYNSIGETIRVDDETSDSVYFMVSASTLSGEGLSDEEQEPRLDVRTYAETPKYKGPTKKGINFSLPTTLDIVESIVDKYVEAGGDVEELIDRLDTIIGNYEDEVE